MVRYSALRSSLLLPVLRHQPEPSRRSLLTLISRVISSTPLPSGTTFAPCAPPSAFTTAAAAVIFSDCSVQSRNFCSVSDSETSNIVLIKSEEDLNAAFRRAEDESLPAIFYYTAKWCGPCQFLWPDVENLARSLKYLTVFKVDIDTEDIGCALEKLNIYSVPTLHFFCDGKKVNEVVGADGRRIKNIADELYKK